jgi:intracellular septation protein A
VNFKFYGFTGLMFLFVMGQALFLARYVDVKES